MQDRYSGDVGDFGKYGLLRWLCGPDFSIGVVWYLVPDEAHNEDGRYVQYLCPTSGNLERYRNCDKELYDKLNDIVRSGTRSVESIQNGGVLPNIRSFHSERLSFENIAGSGRTAKARKLERRCSWVHRALVETAENDLVFFDPDNGFEVSSVERQHRKGPKYVFFDELAPFRERGQSLIVYQHTNRNGTVDEQIRKRMDEVHERLKVAPIALPYRPSSARVFFVIPASRHRDILEKKIAEMERSSWFQHGDFGRVTH